MSHPIRLKCLLALGALALAAQTVPTPVTETTGMIGLAQGQTARLNLLNPGVLPPALGMVCTASVTFFDATGVALKTGALSITPGDSGSIDLASDTDLTIAAGARREIRAQITFPGLTPAASGASSTAEPACRMVPTLEIFDSATGRTLVSLGHTRRIQSVVTSSN